jgi:hypothetical protein
MLTSHLTLRKEVGAEEKMATVRKDANVNSFVEVLSCKYTSPLSLSATGELHCPLSRAFRPGTLAFCHFSKT